MPVNSAEEGVELVVQVLAPVEVRGVYLLKQLKLFKNCTHYLDPVLDSAIGHVDLNGIIDASFHIFTTPETLRQFHPNRQVRRLVIDFGHNSAN